MKKLFLAVVAVCLMSGVCFAGDNININPTNQETSVNNEAGAISGSISGAKAGAVNEGNDINVKSNAWPSLQGAPGVSGLQAYTPMGGAGITVTDEYRAQMDVATMIGYTSQNGFISEDEAKEKINILIDGMMYNVQPKRFCGLFWKTSGRHILNLFGLLSWDSFWKPGQKPFQCQSDMKKEKDYKIVEIDGDLMLR